jgi:hypothetical protein
MKEPRMNADKRGQAVVQDASGEGQAHTPYFNRGRRERGGYDTCTGVSPRYPFDQAIRRSGDQAIRRSAFICVHQRFHRTGQGNDRNRGFVEQPRMNTAGKAVAQAAFGHEADVSKQTQVLQRRTAGKS